MRSSRRFCGFAPCARRTKLERIPTVAEARKLDEAELAARLTAVRGIGPWTVHMLMIFYLGHGNVMPQSLHGGPGRAGGGEELGGIRALNFYHRRAAIQAATGVLSHL